MQKVVVAGHLCLDITPSFPPDMRVDLRDALAPGEVFDVGSIGFSTGGAVSNTGIALAKLGFQVGFSALVGDDEIAHLIRERLAEWGNVKGVRSHKDCSSSYTITLAPPSVDRAFLHYPGCNNSFSEQHIDWQVVRQAQHFHLGYPTVMKALYSDNGETVASIFQKARSLGLTTSLDLALSPLESPTNEKDWRSWFRTVLPHVDLLLPSIEEMLRFWDPETFRKHAKPDDFVGAIPIQVYRQLGSDLLDTGCAVVVLKAGRMGMYVRTGARDRLPRSPHLESLLSHPEQEFWGCPFVQDTIASASGAGDAAIGGFLATLLKGRTITEAIAFGGCLGWQNLRALDAVSGVGDWDETCELIETLPIEDCADDTWSPTDVRGVYRLASG